MRTIVHISDIHFGRTEASSIKMLLAAIETIHPHLVIISGDVTQRARKKEFEECREFLEGIKKAGILCMVIPGNHDIYPWHNPFLRVVRPFARFKEYISPMIDPVYKDEEIAVASLTTVRAYALKNGSANGNETMKIAKWFSELPESLVKIVVTHHPLDLPAEHHERLLARKAKEAIHLLTEAKADMYVSGHYHQSSSIHTIERYSESKYPAIAVQAGTVSVRQRKEGPSFNMITIDKPKLSIDTYILQENSNAYEVSARTSFEFKNNVWQRGNKD